MNLAELLISQDAYTKLFLKAISFVVIDDTLVCTLRVTLRLKGLLSWKGPIYLYFADK